MDPAELSKPELARNLPPDLFGFAERLRRNGLKVDNEPFTWREHQYLIDPYRAFAIPDRRMEKGHRQVLMCGAQVGKTVFGFLAVLYLALRWWGRYLGYFLPDRAMAETFSDVRFQPLVLSTPFAQLWGNDPTAQDKDQKVSNRMRVRSLGRSKIFFSYMGGKTSTESIPMLGVIMDEVRRMAESEIEKAKERISHSPLPVELYFSTAGYPGMNIDALYRLSDQRMFHSRCRCPEGIVLASVFPACLGSRLNGFTPSLQKLPKTFWVCPVCNEPIVNPRLGRWLPHNPESEWGVGHHIPQILSARQSAESIGMAYETSRDKTEFHNSKLGIPYIDPSNQLITPEVLAATVNPDLQWLKKSQNCAMGIDQMGGYNVVVIRKWGGPDERGLRKSVLVHIEIVYSDNPFTRCGELMNLYDVSKCVVDGLPNYNDAHRFVKDFPGRVWIADYTFDGSGTAEICDWMDRPRLNSQQQRAAEETRNKYRVRIDRYKAMEWNLNAFVDRLKTQPHQSVLTQTIKDQAGRSRVAELCREVYWLHLQRIVRELESIDESQGKVRYKYVHVGLDPHFAHADLYCELALSRVSKETGQRAFADYAGKIATEKKTGQHEWEPMERRGDFKCSRCGVTVRTNKKNLDADKISEIGGYQWCGGIR